MNSGKYPINPESLARVRDEAMKAAKKNHDGKLIALAMLADEVLQSYTGAEVKEFQKREFKIGIY